MRGSTPRSLRSAPRSEPTRCSSSTASGLRTAAPNSSTSASPIAAPGGPRARAAAEPAGTMLNLFGYTGAFSVYAAAAGMRTTTVDLSNTYLEWAGENLALNRLTGELVHADVREFLADARRGGRRWDLVVVDPPTFSNSKRMDYTWDLQRDHAALLRDVLAVCGGVVWFSTNRRRFELALDDPALVITDMTRTTIPPDFRDARIHPAYPIR